MSYLLICNSKSFSEMTATGVVHLSETGCLVEGTRRCNMQDVLLHWHVGSCIPCCDFAAHGSAKLKFHKIMLNYVYIL